MAPNKKVKSNYSPSKSSPLKQSIQPNTTTIGSTSSSISPSSNSKGKEKASNQNYSNEFGRDLDDEGEEEEEDEDDDDDDDDDDKDEESSDDEEEEEEAEGTTVAGGEYISKSKTKSRSKGNERGLSNSQIFTQHFLTASTGDKYLLANSTGNGVNNKTSNNLLSNSILSSFTLQSFNSSLLKYDSLLSSQPSLPSIASSFSQKSTKTPSSKFPKYLHELSQSYNLLFYGFGSKYLFLNSLAEECRKKGNVVVLNGFDEAVGVGDLLSALEGIVASAVTSAGTGASGGEEEEDEEEMDEEEEMVGGEGSSKKRRKKPSTSTSSPRKKIISSKPTFNTSLRVPTSALESRIRKFNTSLSHLPSKFPPIYILIHNLDSPSLRLPKTLSLLALLASQKKVHLCATVDHLRAGLLFDINLINGRRPFDLSVDDDNDEEEERRRKGKGKGKFSTSTSTSTNSQQPQAETRSFTFIHHEITTLLPYTLELSHSPLLSSLLPSTIYPPYSSNQSARGGSGLNQLTSSSISNSLLYILPSVTSKSRKLFSLLASLQLTNLLTLSLSEQRSLVLLPPPAASSSNRYEPEIMKSPTVAIKFKEFVERLKDLLLASTSEQVRGLLDEFKDHGVVRFSNIPPSSYSRGEGEGEGEEEEEEEDGEEVGGEWIWIPVGREGLEEVRRNLESGV